MAPKPLRGKKATIATNVQKKNEPKDAHSVSVNYGEAQSEEVEVLQAIFMEDYTEVEVKGWSTTTDRRFELNIRAISDKDAYIMLSVRLTATYPRSAPILEVERLEEFHGRTQTRIRNIIERRPKQLLGEVMISAIADEIQEALEDAVLARQQGTLPSLEDERTNAKQATDAHARQVKEAEEQRLRDAKDEEDRVLQRKAEHMVSQRERQRPTKSADEEPAQYSSSSIITFGKPATIQVGGDRATFASVSVVSLQSQNRDQSSYLATPNLSGVEYPTLVAVKRSKLQRSREDVMELETILDVVQKLTHASIVKLFAYRIDKLDNTKYDLILCTENCDRGTLDNLLELGTLHLNMARRFTTELLGGLDYLHRHGVAHGNLNARTVAIASSPSFSPKLAGSGYSSRIEQTGIFPSKWQASEWESSSPVMQRRSDVWHLGIVVAQMFLGLHITTQYSSPQAMIGRLDLSDSFNDFLRKMFTADAKKRPSAFDLLPAEFLRTSEPIMKDTLPATSMPSQVGHRRYPSGFESPAKRRSRHNSSNVFEHMSRYATDFEEVSRLGKGGFGEVVRATNKIDQGVYAIKKIKQAKQLPDKVITEVMTLNKLNHPYIVRYFGAWIEEAMSGAIIEDSTTETETETGTETVSDGDDITFGLESTTDGLDIHSADPGHNGLGWSDGEDSDEEAADDEQPAPNGSEDVESAEAFADGNLPLRKSRSDSYRSPSTLYIQMEYCENFTLRGLIRNKMTADDSWLYIRQITEGLAHIHEHGLIHRDLKPDNIFIDRAGNPKIGDFGLAATSQYELSDKDIASSAFSGDMTRSIGTALYVAPEIRSNTYNNKIDMYSLGIMFYEMCQPFGTAMERIDSLQEIRKKEHELPPVYQLNGEKFAQGKLISCLISHRPSERPSSTELLRSDILPLKIEDEAIRQALSELSDPHSSYHQKMMSALFAHDSTNFNRVKTLAWDASSTGITQSSRRLRLRGIARQTLVEVFRRHGAEEGRRPTIFPRSNYYTNSNVVQLLDASGNRLQLPYDLTLPHARQVARQPSDVRCTFAFGNAYRDQFDGGPPRVSEEVDFDITDDSDPDEQALNDAEVIKIMDEVSCEMPLFATSVTMSFHINHSRILDAILEHCRVPETQRATVKELLSKLGFHQHTWSKARAELRQFGLSDTSLGDLQQFDFRDAPEKAFSKLRALFEGSKFRDDLDTGVSSLEQVLQFLEPFNLQRKLYVSPLGSVNAKFYRDGMLFQGVLERKSNRVVIAAGGRYDGLIHKYRQAASSSKLQGAVGVSIGLDPILSNMAKHSENISKRSYLKKQIPQEPTTKRCDVLVTPGPTPTDATKLAAIRLLTSFWANDVSAEFNANRTPRTDEHALIVAVKHEASNTVRVTRTGKDSEESEVSISSIIGYVQQELRDQEVSRTRQPQLVRQASQPDNDRKTNVQVLMARHGSKKSNKYQIVNDAQEQWSRKLDEAKSGPILAVETRDEVIDLIQQTRFGDAESWRRAVQSVPLNDRQYVQQIQGMLTSWRKEWAEGDGMREACVFNFRTQHCIYYDLGL